MHASSVIINRLARELEGLPSVALGPGLPQLVRTLLPSEKRLFELNGDDPHVAPLDAVVIEAFEVSAQGDLSLAPEHPQFGELPTRRRIVVTPQTSATGEPRIVRGCRGPVLQERWVDTIITELGVFRIDEVGLVLKEIARGISADDVKRLTAASLHVADDLRLMDL